MKNLLLGAIVALTSTNFVAAAGASIDVSQIIDQNAAESVLGEKIKTPTPRNGQGKDGYYSKCNYYTAGHRSLVLRVHLSDPGTIDPLKELELVAASSGPVKPVDGIGDKAEMFSGGGESGVASRLLMLYIAKGNAFVAIGIGGFDDDSVALEKAKGVAQKILERL